jgi:hypothetical protein
MRKERIPVPDAETGFLKPAKSLMWAPASQVSGLNWIKMLPIGRSIPMGGIVCNYYAASASNIWGICLKTPAHHHLSGTVLIVIL